MIGRVDTSPTAAPSLLLVLLCWLALMWPSVANKGPFLFSDTTAYVRGVDAGVSALTGKYTKWSLRTPEGNKAAPGTEVAGGGGETAAPDGRIVLAGRSVYYGFLAYLSYVLTDGFWLVAGLQALLVAIATTMTVSRFLPPGTSLLARAGAAPALLSCTAAPYFAGFVMPDIFTGLAILAVGNLAAFWREDGRARRVFWSVLLAFALLSHSSNLLLAMALAALGVMLAVFGIARVPRAAGLAIAATIVIAIIGEVAFSLVVRGTTGEAPVRPPFLTARIVDDGPGYRHLQATCPGGGYVLCRMIDHPPTDSDTFLWSPKRGEGSFLSGSTSDARRLSAEQGRFVLDVVKARPIEVIASSLGAIGRQAAMMDLSEFNYDPATRGHLERKLPLRQLARVKASAAYRGSMPTGFVANIAAPLSTLSLLAVVLALSRGWRVARVLAPQTVFALVVILGVVINLAISGAISTPHDRYNMRALWLLPVLAATLLPLWFAGRIRVRSRSDVPTHASYGLRR